MSELLEHALALAGAGWSVFSCDQTKRPLVAGGVHAATRDPDRIRRFFRANHAVMIGAAVPDSLAVLDIDADHDGFATLRALEEAYGELPTTLTVRTGGGGEHRYFLHPGGELRQTAGLLGPGLDTRMPGKGYTILPPSVHDSGRPYAWSTPLAPTAPLPGWLEALLRPPSPSRPGPVRQSAGPIGADRYVRAAVEGEVANVIGAPVGTRNATLHLASVKLGTMVGAGLLDRAEARAVLLEAARASGYVASDGERTAVRTIESGLRFGVEHPRERAR